MVSCSVPAQHHWFENRIISLFWSVVNFKNDWTFWNHVGDESDYESALIPGKMQNGVLMRPHPVILTSQNRDRWAQGYWRESLPRSTKMS